MITMQTYVQAQSLEEAWQLNQKRSARILGGMLWTRMESRPVSTAIDLCRLGLDTIEETDAAFTLGAMVTLRQIELHPGLAAYTGGAAAAAVRDIVGVQFRNMATIGGSVWGRFGFSDLLTWLLASGAAVELYKGGVVPLEAFAAMPYDRDVLVRVILPKRPGAAFAYQAVRIGRTDLPGGNYGWIMKSIIDRILPLGEETAIYPGHGPSSTLGHEMHYNPFITEVMEGEVRPV